MKAKIHLVFIPSWVLTWNKLMLCLHFSVISTVEIKHIPFLMLGLISDSWLIGPFSFHDANTSNTLISKYFSHLHGCHYCSVWSGSVSNVSIPITSLWWQLLFCQEYRRTTLGQRREYISCTMADTFQLLRVLGCRHNHCTNFLSHFPSSKRHGPNPTGIYEHLTMDVTNLLLTSANLAETWLLLPAFLCSWTLQGNC